MPQDPIRRRVDIKGGQALILSSPPNSNEEVPMKVKDAMHKGVDWVNPDTPVTELAKLMREHDIGATIGEDDQLIGVVTDRDIL